MLTLMKLPKCKFIEEDREEGKEKIVYQISFLWPLSLSSFLHRKKIDIFLESFFFPTSHNFLLEINIKGKKSTKFVSKCGEYGYMYIKNEEENDFLHPQRRPKIFFFQKNVKK